MVKKLGLNMEGHSENSVGGAAFPYVRVQVQLSGDLMLRPFAMLTKPILKGLIYTFWLSPTIVQTAQGSSPASNYNLEHFILQSPGKNNGTRDSCTMTNAAMP